MLSIGILWNCANNFKEDILKDIGQKTRLLEHFELDLGDQYVDFVRDIYSSEDMENWKIEKKISHMINYDNTTITILFFEFNEKEIAYHPYKKKNVFVQLENCKMYIREKYKNKIQNYTFDIIFHATDNLTELQNTFNIIVSYLKKKKITENKVLKLALHKDFNRGESNE